MGTGWISGSDEVGIAAYLPVAVPVTRASCSERPALIAASSSTCRMCANIHRHTHTHTHNHLLTNILTHTRTHAHTHRQIHIHARTHALAHTHEVAQTRAHRAGARLTHARVRRGELIRKALGDVNEPAILLREVGPSGLLQPGDGEYP